MFGQKTRQQLNRWRGHAGRGLLLALLALALVPGVRAAGEDHGYKEVSAPLVKHMMASEDAMVINVLSVIDYELHHIQGSINIPIDRLQGSTLLPQDFDRPLVFYCMGHR